MKLIIFAGFLGTGKTTLLLAIAKDLVAKGQKVAIIENEVGKTGIDDQFLKQEGLKVRELYSGCVCCSLRVDLLTTLTELEQQEHPEVVLVEPSGVAGPHLVANVFQSYQGSLESIRLFVLIDLPRIKLLLDQCGFFVTAGLESADVILLTKLDAVTEHHLKQAHAQVQKINPKAKIIPISALHGTHLDLVREILSTSNKDDLQNSPLPSPRPSGLSKETPDTLVYSREISLGFSLPQTSARLKVHIADHLHKLAVQLQQAGCPWVGHIKAILKVPRSGCLLFSSTDFGQTPSCRGGIKGPVSRASLTLNVIVGKMDRKKFDEQVGKTIKRLRILGTAGMESSH